MFNAIIRGTIVAIGLSLQILLLLITYLYLGDKFVALNVLYQALGFIVVLWLIKKSKSYSYTLPWMLIILLLPLAGVLLYLIIGRNIKKSKVLKNITLC